MRIEDGGMAVVSGGLIPLLSTRRLIVLSQCSCAAAVTVAGAALTVDARNHEVSALTF